ncbi:magnesium transporter MgtE N-terminal domain-containing protein [Alkalihalobacillus trypoxylicola]|uniref:Magnesium transporter MgtE intracellular domain-containing protein n=1 Tax=Alkalihalobacillus trypoxylicola TaxID=519424 RepID=A0A162F8R8_9BACI|nr:hypothetical protein [Alkalihalobacillus trypoxylicola]KYG35055.1 hypothetical protein AZF04_01595 [Alkalihalobacillus trypoxylicola]
MNETKKKMSKFQWFMVIFIIPFVLILALAVVTLTVVEHPTIEKIKSSVTALPVVSLFFDDQAEVSELQSEEFEQLEQQLLQQQENLTLLNETIEQRDSQIAELEQELLEIGALLSEENSEDDVVQTNATNSYEEIGKLYENMSAKNAARIIAELTIDESIVHLDTISSEEQSKIISKLESEQAAEIMKRLANR